MGLDTVELVMEVEESFGIKIPDDRASEMRTVGDLYSFVLDETCDLTRDPTKCLSAATFYALRSHITSIVDNVEYIRPNTMIETSLPRRARHVLWTKLQNKMDLRFPRLCRPAWLKLLAYIAMALVSVGVYLWLLPEVGYTLAVFVAFIAAILSVAAFTVLTAPFAVVPGNTFTTYRGLVNQLTVLNYAKLSSRHASWNPTDVWNILQSIIVEQLGVRKEDVTPNANFVYDLGAS